MDWNKRIFRSGITTMVISLLFFCVGLKAQPFQPFPGANAKWTIGVYDVFGAFHYGYYYKLDAVNTDTTIGSGVYKKIYRCDSLGHTDYKGALRQDAGRKVFFMQPDSVNEKLLYDFSANAGDTVYNVYSDYASAEPVHNEEILDVDSIAINGAYHRRLLLHLNFYWIEGIGCNGGLFESTYGGTFAYVYKLDCFTKDSVPIYSSATGNCLLSGVTELEAESNYNLYPNPGKGLITLHYDAPLQNTATLNVYNATGACVFKTLLKQGIQQHSIDLKQLGDGIYFYTITTASTMQTGKIILEK